ncbi:hypothetical protein MD535_25270 [Vibrio sp. ZSDZ65]|uniref:ParG protein n=1 Tax=Vibrio qingdaonensis TaxID=2829491 RepID=A0A9X3HZ59_9VIBR|nr:hypothetical protein [Vibrio qingdaonensis]MCW8349296.1 hypothetical protein [Vibrio qingdaonensis]
MLKIKKTGEGHQHPKVKDVSKVTTKEDTSRLNADLPKSFYLKVKMFAMENDMSITDMTKEALTEYMKTNDFE